MGRTAGQGQKCEKSHVPSWGMVYTALILARMRHVLVREHRSSAGQKLCIRESGEEAEKLMNYKAGRIR